jgi:hypothetical protein
MKSMFPEYTDANIWPPEHLLPGFRETFEELARLIVGVGALLAKVFPHLGDGNSRLVTRMVCANDVSCS